jgi:hypothetical protein
LGKCLVGLLLVSYYPRQVGVTGQVAIPVNFYGGSSKFKVLTLWQHGLSGNESELLSDSRVPLILHTLLHLSMAGNIGVMFRKPLGL